MTAADETPHRLDATLRLLDRQLVDADGRNAGKVDDLELTERDDGPPFVSAVLSGPGALAGRIGGRLGAWLGSIHRRLDEAENPEPARIDFGLVRSIDSDVVLSVTADALETHDGERWARDHVIRHIPGARRAAE